ncbi:hypothetical protein BHU25_16855 [Pseudomonas vranovensis]|uniref:Uncharacterized protein n=1 Tax=Pseudomonas vranovensis TaxID=321661 RepID=A0A423DGQ7_9PSED|nr:hypothetical protein BHU25_16855 [Pseudomonas vranovensis]
MKEQKLEEILKKMLNENTDISARSVIRETDSPFKHASDVTRQPQRKALLERYQNEKKLPVADVAARLGVSTHSLYAWITCPDTEALIW